VALEIADWSPVTRDCEVTVFADHLADEDEAAARLNDFEIVVIMRERTPFPRAMFEKLPNLKLLVTSGMRNLSIDLAAAKECGVLVCGTPSGGSSTAELAWGLILGLLRHIPEEDRATRLGAWQRTLGIGLEGKTLGIMGLGRIGSQMAAVGNAFRMNVIAWSSNLTEARCAECGATLVTMDELLSQSDVVTIQLILGDRTRGLLGARELALMKPTAYLVNTSRGPIVDEKALIETLENKRIAGAAIDVFDVEPLPLDHPFRRLGNTVITPHLGYVAAENYVEYYGGAVADIRAWLDGSPINELKPPGS
jgi:phosphoglycerate dehydrogenase-like enzyme